MTTCLSCEQEGSSSEEERGKSAPPTGTGTTEPRPVDTLTSGTPDTIQTQQTWRGAAAWVRSGEKMLTALDVGRTATGTGGIAPTYAEKEAKGAGLQEEVGAAATTITARGGDRPERTTQPGTEEMEAEGRGRGMSGEATRISSSTEENAGTTETTTETAARTRT